LFACLLCGIGTIAQNYNLTRLGRASHSSIVLAILSVKMTDKEYTHQTQGDHACKDNKGFDEVLYHMCVYCSTKIMAQIPHAAQVSYCYPL
jgi:hypothetical protein